MEYVFRGQNYLDRAHALRERQDGAHTRTAQATGHLAGYGVLEYEGTSQFLVTASRAKIEICEVNLLESPLQRLEPRPRKELVSNHQSAST